MCGGEHSLFPFASLFQCFTLFLLNFIKTFASHSSCFSICHSKNIISLDSSIYSAISWNWLTQRFNFFIFGYLIDSEELFNSFSVFLGCYLLSLIFQIQFVICLCLIVQSLFFFNFRRSFRTIKCMILRWRYWLLIKIFTSLNSYYLSSGFYLSSFECMVYKLLLHYRIIFDVCWLINSSCK